MEENNKKRKTRDRDRYQKIQEIKGKFKTRLGLLNNQQGITLSDQGKGKGRQSLLKKKVKLQKRQKDDRSLYSYEE